MDEGEEEIKRKQNYIYENIQKIKNHRNYIDFIKLKKCPHTINANGIFINLTRIDSNIIKELYQILDNELKNNTTIDNSNEKELLKIEIKSIKEKKHSLIKKDISFNTIIYLNDFNDEDQKIIKLSKKYQL